MPKNIGYGKAYKSLKGTGMSDVDIKRLDKKVGAAKKGTGMSDMDMAGAKRTMGGRGQTKAEWGRKDEVKYQNEIKKFRGKLGM